jgi:hypothetical protein
VVKGAATTNSGNADNLVTYTDSIENMGALESKPKLSSGSFQSPSSARPGVTSLPTVAVSEKKFRFKVPQGKRSGQTMDVLLNSAHQVTLTIPMSQQSPSVPLKGGDSFVYTHKGVTGADSKVHFSSLQFLPGKDVVVTRAMIWASYTITQKMRARRAQSDEGPSEEAMAMLMEGVKAKLIQKAISMNPSNNAVLGVQFQVVNDSMPFETLLGGVDMLSKQVIVVASGTPCTVVESEALAAFQGSSAPVALAEAVILK